MKATQWLDQSKLDMIITYCVILDYEQWRDSDKLYRIYICTYECIIWFWKWEKCFIAKSITKAKMNNWPNGKL